MGADAPAPKGAMDADTARDVLRRAFQLSDDVPDWQIDMAALLARMSDKPRRKLRGKGK